MLIHVQPPYFKKVSELLSDSDAFQLIEAHKSASADVIIGTPEYLHLKNPHKQILQQVAVFSQENCEAGELVHLSEQAHTVVVHEANLNQIPTHLHRIYLDDLKKKQIEQIRTDIQRKRKELEALNQQLKSESDQKIQFLEISHTEETEKNQNEKSLLHFLDFIQSESISDDFIEKLFRFIWKDIKKHARLYTLGISYQSVGGTRLVTYNGVDESSVAVSVDFNSSAVASQLAGVWGRPVGSILKWVLPENSRPIFLFIEVVDRQVGIDKIIQYMSERLAVLSLYIDRWLIEKEIELVVNRWKNTFRSFSGYTHVIDEDFRVYHSNYIYPREAGPSERPHCYKVLAGRNQPCEQCPVVKNKNTILNLKDEQVFKTYHSQFRFENKNYYFVIYEDVTKIAFLQSQIIQTEKMSTLGRLGNHLAHELNNPLTGIKSYVQTLLADQSMMDSLPQTAASDLSEILKATVRCQKIIKNFIDFSQNKEPVLEATNFNEVLQNTLVLLKSALRNHRLFVDIKDQNILANSHDLQQVLFNIIKNACQAMKSAGSIKIYQEVIKEKIYIHIEDSGPGFAPDVLKHIFQPFTTTKAQGEGTGLGLYLSKKLINNMHADLQISTIAQGAKVTLIFDCMK